MIRVSEPSIFLQRLAWLRVAAYHGMTRQRSAEELATTIYRIAAAPMDPRVDELGRLQEYARLRQAADRLGDFSTVPAQDLWLCRSKYSWNGSLTRANASEVPDWAVSAGVSRPGTLTTTGIGRRLVAARGIREDADWTRASANPFVLENGEKLVLLDVIWRTDGDLLREWLPMLPPDRPFGRLDAGSMLEAALAALVSAATTTDAVRLGRLRTGLVKQAEESRRRGIREHWSTPRIEQLVDLGILTKPELARYDSAFTDAGLRLRSALRTANSGLDLARAVWAPGAAEAGITEAETAMREGYFRTRTTLGMADIDDIWTVANSSLLMAEAPSWIGRDLLDEVVKSWLSSGEASFSVDKLGRIKYVKMQHGSTGGGGRPPEATASDGAGR